MNATTKVYTIRDWLMQPDYREAMVGKIFVGAVRREPSIPVSVYQIVEFLESVENLPIVSATLFDKSPYLDPQRHRTDIVTLNLRNYRNHRQIEPEEVLHEMKNFGLETKYLGERGYLLRRPRQAI